MKRRILSRRIPNCLRSCKSARPNLRPHSLAQEETQGPLLVMHYFRKISSVWPLRKSKKMTLQVLPDKIRTGKNFCAN